MIEPVGQDGHDEGAAAPVPSSPPNVVALPSGHSVTLHPEVTLPLGIACISAIKGALHEGQPAVEAALAEAYLRFGIASWTFRDVNGDPVPVTAESIARMLPFNGGGLEVAEAADALYGEAVTRPLVQRSRLLSPPGPTGGGTPPSSPRGQSRTSPARSSRRRTAGKRSGDPAR
jgi:hypothetical protein